METMTLYVAMMLLGQVGNSGDTGTIPVDQLDPAVIQAAGQEPSPPATFRSPAPFRPQADAPLQPSARRTVDTIQPAATIRQPAATIAEPPAEPAAPAGSLQIGTSMIQQILKPDEPAPKNVRQVRLVETLTRIGADPTRQASTIRAYWELAQAIASSRFSADKLRMVSEIAAPNADADRVLLAEAIADAEAEVAAAEDAVLAAQFGLLRASSLPFEDQLPWPADAPLIAPYRTQFASIFAHQPAPLGLLQIHLSLPGKLTLIEKRVAAMAAAETASDTLLAHYQQGAGSLVQLLAAIERLDRARRVFLTAVIDYNDQIARYSVAVVGSGVGSETLVATLIKLPAATVEVPRVARQAGTATPTRQGLQTR
jgi:hypothetical protein